MPSSPREPQASALQELRAAWQASLDALARGEVDVAAAAIAELDTRVDPTAIRGATSSEVAELRAMSQQLEQELQSALTQTGEELRQVRMQRKALGGYRRTHNHDAQQLDQQA